MYIADVIVVTDCCMYTTAVKVAKTHRGVPELSRGPEKRKVKMERRLERHRYLE